MRPWSLLALAAAAWLALPLAALGHAALVSATPGPGESIVDAPAEIVARFSQDLDMSRTAMEVRDAGGNVVASGPTRGETAQELRLALPELAPGVYEVRWTSFSAEDGELERGRYTFTVLAPSAAPVVSPSGVPASPAAFATGSTPSPTAPAEGADGTGAALLFVGIAVIALVAAGAWWLRRR